MTIREEMSRPKRRKQMRDYIYSVSVLLPNGAPDAKCYLFRSDERAGSRANWLDCVMQMPTDAVVPYSKRHCIEKLTPSSLDLYKRFGWEIIDCRAE